MVADQAIYITHLHRVNSVTDLLVYKPHDADQETLRFERKRERGEGEGERKRERVRNGLNWNIGDDGWEMELTRRWEGKHILFKEEDEKNERGRLKTKMTRIQRKDGGQATRAKIKRS